MKKKVLSVILVLCIIVVTMPIVTATEIKHEKMLFSQCSFGKYAYYHYNNSGDIDSFVIVNNNEFDSFAEAKTDATAMISLDYSNDSISATRYEKSISTWVSKEKKEFFHKLNTNEIIHYRYINNEAFLDYIEINSYNKDGNIIKHSVKSFCNDTATLYSISYDYNDSGFLQHEYHYLNNQLNHIDSFVYDQNDKMLLSVVDNEKTVYQYNKNGEIKSISKSDNESIVCDD